MPYTRVTRAKNGAEAIQYARGIDGKGHNNKERRNEYITGINMAPDSCVPFEVQMQEYWDKARAGHTNQVIRYVVSFSPKELDPKNPADILKAHEIVCGLMRKVAPGHQVAVFTQTDGVGGKIHVHGLANDVHTETYKRIPNINTHQYHFRQMSDEFCSQYFELDIKESIAEEKEPHAVRVAKSKNQEIREYNAKELEAAQKEDREPVLKKEKYVWKEDLKQRILRAAEGAEDEQDFIDRLKAERVRLIPDKAGNVRRHATKTQPEHYTYELIVEEKDLEGLEGKIPERTRAKSFKLGANYQPEGVAKRFKEKEQEKVQTIQETQPAQKTVRPKTEDIVIPKENEETIEVIEPKKPKQTMRQETQDKQISREEQLREIQQRQQRKSRAEMAEAMMLRVAGNAGKSSKDDEFQAGG